MLGQSENPKVHKDYNFHCRIILGDTNSKHILIILVIDSWDFRELQELFSESEKERTQNRKSKSLLIKTWNFSSMSILKPQFHIGLRVLQKK